jgi:recombinational DNA repair protein RecT
MTRSRTLELHLSEFPSSNATYTKHWNYAVATKTGVRRKLSKATKVTDLLDNNTTIRNTKVLKNNQCVSLYNTPLRITSC